MRTRGERKGRRMGEMGGGKREKNGERDRRRTERKGQDRTVFEGASLQHPSPASTLGRRNQSRSS